MSDPHRQWCPQVCEVDKATERSKASDRNVRPTQAVATHRVCEVHTATERSKASDKNVRPTKGSGDAHGQWRPTGAVATHDRFVLGRI
jgi:hypothetical protein